MKTKLLLSFILLITNVANAQLFKVSDQGAILNNSSTDQRCILDDKSKLVWEVKLASKGLQNTQNTYTWFDGKTGILNGDYSHNCHWASECNTKNYVKNSIVDLFDKSLQQTKDISKDFDKLFEEAQKLLEKTLYYFDNPDTNLYA